MKVKELIALLQAYPPNAKVHVPRMKDWSMTGAPANFTSVNNVLTISARAHDELDRDDD